MISTDGIIIRMPVDQISTFQRPAKGVKVMRVNEGEKLATISVVGLPEMNGVVLLVPLTQGKTIPLFSLPNSSEILGFGVILSASLVNEALPIATCADAQAETKIDNVKNIFFIIFLL